MNLLFVLTFKYYLFKLQKIIINLNKFEIQKFENVIKKIFMNKKKYNFKFNNIFLFKKKIAK